MLRRSLQRLLRYVAQHSGNWQAGRLCLILKIH